MGKKRRSRSDRNQHRKQAIAKQIEALNTPEGRFEFVNAKGLSNLKARYKKGKGIKRNEAKKTGKDIELIHSFCTLQKYAGSWKCFATWFSTHISSKRLIQLDSFEKDIEGWTEIVNQYLQFCIENELAPNTQASYKSAIAKVLGISSTSFIPTQPRTRASRTNNRLFDRDERLSDKNNEYWHKVVSATGLRKKELMNITGDAMQRGRNGRWYLNINGHKHQTKGRRDRWAPIMPTSKEEEDWLVEIFRRAGKRKVFQVPKDLILDDFDGKKVPTALKPHKYRAEYAERVYLNVVRDISKIKNRKEIIYLRKELAGIALDRVACKIVTKALGHNRPDEFPKSYAYKLLKR
ncbi:hypothetical protein GCM10011510_19020 [Streptococcus himalayensis]|uniref:Integrase n=2 Tax=Streptococcus himalayensis TaxID=1888195 RepID=A0A917AA83_9STRE|nr:hypothetical protein GCM10011510_19020 [Streptococcus himalayensis]